MNEVKRSREIELVRGGRYVVAVPVEVVYLSDDPTDPCVSPETMEFLEEVARRAEAGDVAYLRSVGEVFQALGKTG